MASRNGKFRDMRSFLRLRLILVKNADIRLKIDKNGSARTQKRPHISEFSILMSYGLIETG